MQPVHDLRRAFLAARAFRPAGEEGGSLLPSPPTPSSPADDGDQTENEHGDADESKLIRNQRLKSLSDECAKHRNNTKTEKDRADAAEAKLAAVLDQTSTIAELRKHNAFLLAAAGKVNDLDAAWKLTDQSAVTVADDGKVTGFDHVIASTLERYPYLVPDDAPLPPFQPVPTVPSGKPNPRQHGNDATRHVLEGKFPALKKR